MRRAHLLSIALNGGHASLCPPYDTDLCGTLHRSGRHIALDLGGHGHEILVTPFRTLSYCDLVSYFPERYRSVANRNRPCHRTSQHYGRSAETGGKATQAAADWKPGTEIDASGISPDIAKHSNTVNRSNAGACEKFNHGEACCAGEDLQQLHRWLPNELQIWQPTLEWMFCVGRQFYVLFNVQKRAQLQNLQ